MIIALKSEKQRMEGVLDAIADSVSFQDPEFKVVYQNRAHRAIFGDQAGKFCYEAYHRADQVCEDCPVQVALLDGRPHTSVKSVQAPDGQTLFAEITASPVRSGTGAIIGAVEVARDITGQVRTERLLAQALELVERERKRSVAAQASERFAALGRMVSVIAHEINNPLSAISGCAEGLMARVERGDCDALFFKRYLAIIKDEVFRCKGITSSMLAVTREEACERKRFDIGAVVGNAVDLIALQGRMERVDLLLDLPQDLPAVTGNEQELVQVMLTIITNALDAMGDRGALIIRASACNEDLRITVNDSGPGIDPDFRDRIFEPFFSTKTGPARGLGLSIARRIVANHGGTITMATNNDAGATFIVSLPIDTTVKEETL